MKRPNAKKLTIPWKEFDNCPCGSGKLFWACCQRIGSQPYINIPSVVPPTPITNYAHSKCYMRSTHNCSLKISREHFISESILSQFTGGIVVDGLPWQQLNASNRYPSKALASNILCQRHNSALSPLDEAAGHFFREFRAAVVYATKKSMLKKTAYFLVSGDAMECWGVKTLLGIYHSRIASTEGKCLADYYTFDEKTAVDALSDRMLSQPLGMFVCHQQDEVIEDTIGVSPLTNAKTHRLTGIRVAMVGICFDFLIDTEGANPQFFEERTFYRPQLIDINGPKRTSRLILSWPNAGTRGKRISISIATSYN